MGKVLYLNLRHNVSINVCDEIYDEFMRTKDRFSQWLDSFNGDIELVESGYDEVAFVTVSKFNTDLKLENKLFDLLFSERQTGYDDDFTFVEQLLSFNMSTLDFDVDVTASFVIELMLINDTDLAWKVKEVEAKLGGMKFSTVDCDAFFEVVYREDNYTLSNRLSEKLKEIVSD
ncbi:MAG: hypothetical protein J6Y37_14440 [Paludibacteraceae bacterium]|nr:hypothetical protein [Paludibacteraceae bacterium]